MPDEHEDARQDRVKIVVGTSGALTGAYGPDYLVQLREDWPD
jgi:hypothetical protein